MRVIFSYIIRNFIKFSLFALAATPAFSVTQEYRIPYYTINYSAATLTATVSAPWGQWSAVRKGGWEVLELISTPAGLLQPTGTTAHVAEFEFQSPDYFTETNQGHFGIFLRGDLFTPTGNPLNTDYPYRGHGVVLGNVTGYPSIQHPYGYPCTPTPSTPVNSIAIEVAGLVPSSPTTLNCVFGQLTHGNGLQNNVKYKIQVMSEFDDLAGLFVTRYTLSSLVNGSWVLHSSSAVAYPYPTLPPNLGGWFIAEVFNKTNNWHMEITNFYSYWN
ncbi:MAG: hypothetical protein ABI606_02450 [Rhodoferax sp.]